MARLKAINDAASTLAVALARTGSPDDHLHLASGAGVAQGFPEAGDYMLRVQYDKAHGSYDVTKEQWSIVRGTKRPSTTHGADADTIDITWVESGADAPSEWPIGSIVFNAVSKEYDTEYWAAIDGKAPANPVATDAIWTAKGQVAYATASAAATVRNELEISAHGNCGASEAFNLLTLAQHSATVDQAATEMQVKDPGMGCKSWLYLTASADSDLTWKNEAGAGALTLYWINDAPLVSVVDTQKYIIQMIRMDTDTYWIGYLPVDWTE